MRGRHTAGDVIAGRYRLTEHIATGGMGQVWEAVDSRLGRRVAVKVLHEHLARDQRLVSRFLSEARTLTLIQHENVVSIYDLDMRDGRPSLVMEYLEGQSLAAFVKGPLETALAHLEGPWPS